METKKQHIGNLTQKNNPPKIQRQF